LVGYRTVRYTPATPAPHDSTDRREQRPSSTRAARSCRIGSHLARDQRGRL